MSVQLLRSSRVWASTVTEGFTRENTIEILVQDDLSFSQDSNSTDITVNEAGPRPTRGSKRFNDSLNPAEWNFSTYILPYLDSTDNLVKVPDYILWQGLASGSPIDLEGENGVHANDTNMLVDFKDNAYHELTPIQIYILLDKVWYHIRDCQIGQAEVNVDIDDIGLVAWSGNGTQLVQMDAAPFDSVALGMTDEFYASLQSSYLKNKLTILRMRDMEADKSYDIPITGGSFTINNNITYLTPNTLSRVDIPIGSFTGAFEMTGSLSAYMNDKALGSAELYQDLLTTLKATNQFEITMILGGEYDTPRPAAVIVLKQAHVNVPSIETDDVLGTTVEFKAIPTELDSGDEGYLGFSPIYTKALVTNLINNGDGANDSAPVITVTSVSVAPTSSTGAVGTTEQLTVTVLPANATNKDVTFTTGDADIATVSSTGLITRNEEGSTSITVTSVEGNKVATHTVTVTA